MALMHLDNIRVGERLRPLNEAKVQELIESVRELGLLNPITVTDEGLLIAGYHRLEACRRLALEDEAYGIVPISYFDQPDKSRQAEIAENLYRNELSLLQRAEHLSLYLETLPRVLPAAEQAAALGMSRKTFFNYRRLVRELPAPLRERIKRLDGDLRDSTGQLLELAALPAAQQEAWISALEQARQPGAAKPDRQSRTRQHFSLSIPAGLQGQLSNTAARHGLNQGDFTRRLLEQALLALEQGQLSLDSHESL